MAYPTDVTLPANVTITAEGDRWAILTDGKRTDGYIYPSEDEALKMAMRQAEMRAVHAVIEGVIGQERHYGIRVWSEPSPYPDAPTPRWFITDPHHDQEAYAFAWYSGDPPPVDVYTRQQYETACAALELDPAPDSDLGGYGDKYGEYDLWTYTPRQAIGYQLRHRRLAGIKREKAAEQAPRAQELQEAGLAAGPLGRDDYERACQISGVPALADGACVTLVDNDVVRLAGRGVMVVDPATPDDAVTADLARRRVEAIEADAARQGRRCDECGAVIVGSGMTASLGLACGVDCYDAMADRPGRYGAAR